MRIDSQLSGYGAAETIAAVSLLSEDVIGAANNKQRNGMMKKLYAKIATFALALSVAVVAIAAGESSVSIAGQNDKTNVSTNVAYPRKVALNLPVLMVKKRISGTLSGSCSFLPMEVSVSGKQTPLRVSFSDDTPNGSGTTIRNSLWSAALVAALQKESALQGVRISLDFKGGVDGPSAGAVMCLGIMSALDGREFPDDFAMTGTILLDGTIGLVGGVPEKLKAAARNQKIKRVAIPAFQRFAKDANEKWIDLFELGRELGLELCPVESIGDAYCFLHRETISRPVIPTALSVIREDSVFEANAAEVFRSRDLVVRERLAGLSSNDLQTVMRGFEWESINPEDAERRFEEGAIFDALELIVRSDACLTAVLKSWEFFHDYKEGFLNKADEKRKLFKKSLRNTEMHDWPIETQLAFVDGFRKEMSDFCETVLGWKNNDEGNSKEETTQSEEPWFGVVPEEGASDLDAQLLSLVEETKAEGQYRYMVKQTYSRADLKKALQDAERSIYEEIEYDRKKLFFLMSTKYRVPGFHGVSVPTMNAGGEVASVLELFRKAWVIADGIIESDVVDYWANNAAVRKEDVREHFIGKDHRFAVYDAARRWGKIILALYDDAVNNDDNPFGYSSYTDSNLLFIFADLFAEASAQLLSLDKETENASFAAFVTDRARTSALLGMEACRKAGIPCFGSVLAFQKAERSRAERNETVTQILANYWKATMSAKALLMAFKNGKGPKQGFSWYQLSEESVAAKKSMEAMLQVVLNADFKQINQSLPTVWMKSISDSAAVIAEEFNEEEWSMVRDVLDQSGRLLACKNRLLVDLMATNYIEGVDKDVIQRVLANWGEKLIGISKAVSRETIANGKLMDVLMSAPGCLDGTSLSSRFPMPKIEARQKSRNAVEVFVPDWSAVSPTLVHAFGDEPDLFQKMDGKMVLADLIPVFKDSAAWKSLVVNELSKAKSEEKRVMLVTIRAISDTLKKAMECEDKDSLEAVLGEVEASALFQKLDDTSN